jgi:hypothetical protein
MLAIVTCTLIRREMSSVCKIIRLQSLVILSFSFTHFTQTEMSGFNLHWFFKCLPIFKNSFCFLLQCNFGHCHGAFHATCARESGLFMSVRIGAGGRLQYRAYCDRHSSSQRAKVIMMDIHHERRLF